MSLFSHLVLSDSATPWTVARQASLPSPSPRVCPLHGDAVQPSHPLTAPSPSALNLSQHQGLFQCVSSLHQMTKILELQLQHQSFQRAFRVVSLKTDWFDLLPVHGTFRSLLQHHSSKASILWCPAFFMVQLSQPYVTTEKIIALTIMALFGKLMSLLINTMSGFIVAFLPRSSHLLISRLQSPSAVILEPKKRKSVTASAFTPCVCHEVSELSSMTRLSWVALHGVAHSLIE